MTEIIPGFGDNIRIRSTPLTRQLGYADRNGSIYGETTPSLTGVEVVGDTAHDFALNVVFDDGEPKGGLWFAAELVELVDHAPGMEIRVGDTHLVRRADGEWESASPKSSSGFISWLMRSFRGRG